MDLKQVAVSRHLPYEDYLDMVETLNCKAELYNLLKCAYQGESYTPFEKGLDNALKVIKRNLTEKQNMRNKMLWFLTEKDNKQLSTEEELRIHDLPPKELLNEFINCVIGSNVNIAIED